LTTLSTDLWIRVLPRASRNEWVGWRDGRLVVRLVAPPVEGAANEACRTFLAEQLGVRRSQIELVAGEKSRVKRIRIAGLEPAELQARLRARGVPDPVG